MASTPRSIDIAAFIDGRRLGAFNYRLILLSWLITLFDGFDMMMISFTAPYMRDALGLDKPMLGNVFSAGLFGMMLGGFAFAYIGDRIGRRLAIVVAAFAFGVLTMATALASLLSDALTEEELARWETFKAAHAERLFESRSFALFELHGAPPEPGE